MGGNGCPQREITRLALHVIRGENLWTTAGHVADTQVIVSLLKDDATVAFKTSSKVVRAESSPEWQLTSVVDLPHPKPLRCTVQIEVVKVPPLKIGFRRSMCSFSSDLPSLLDQARLIPSADPEKDGSDADSVTTALSEPFWLDCQHKGHRRGRLLVQAQYLNRIEAKPIRILVLTWNMGNAPPSPAFSTCFPDSEMGVYDLIVVGTQESAYSAPSRPSMTSAAAQLLPAALNTGNGITPEPSVISDALSDTGRIPDGSGGGLHDEDSGAVRAAGEITPFYLDDSPEPSQSILSEEAPSDWRSARSEYSGHSSEFAIHGEELSAGALSEGMEVGAGMGDVWPGAEGEEDEEACLEDGGMPQAPLASGARSAYVDEAGTMHYANASGAFPTLPTVSESAELGEVDDGGAFVDGGTGFARMLEPRSEVETGEGGDGGMIAPPMPGRIKSERSLNLMPVVLEEPEGTLEDSTRRISSSDVRSSAGTSVGDVSPQPTAELSGDVDVGSGEDTEASASGALLPLDAEGAGSAQRLWEEAAGQAGVAAATRPPMGAGRAAPWGPGRRGLGEGRGRLVFGAQERAAEWLDSAALPSLCGQHGPVGEDIAGQEIPPHAAADLLINPRPLSIGAASAYGPGTRGSGSGQSSGSAGQWEPVRVADAMQAPAAAAMGGAGMLGALPHVLMRERSVTDISLGNLSEPWASGYTPSYPPSSTEVTPCATVIGSEHGGRDDAADTQELATVSPVAAAPTSPLLSTSNTAPNTMQLLTSYPGLAEFSTVDPDGDTWLAHTSGSGAAAAALAPSDSAKFEAAAVRHARSQARAQSRRPPRGGGSGARRPSSAAAPSSSDSPTPGASSSFDRIGRHLDGNDICVESVMYSSSGSEGGASGPRPRHVWDQTASAPLQMGAPAAAWPGLASIGSAANSADAVSVPLQPGGDVRSAGLHASSPRLPLRRKGRSAQHTALVAELERVLAQQSPSARDTITRHAAAGAVVARAAFERARSASPLGAAARGRRAVAFANAPASDADILSAREMAREQAACARSTRPRGVIGRGRPAAVHSPSPETTARHRGSLSTPASLPTSRSMDPAPWDSPERTPILRSTSRRSPTRPRPPSALPDSLAEWARSRSGSAAAPSPASGENSNTTTSASSVPMFRSPPSPSSAPTPSMSAFTGHLPVDSDGGAGDASVAGAHAAPALYSTLDSSEAVTANPSFAFTDMHATGRGDTGATAFFTATEGASRMTGGGSGQASDFVSVRSADGDRGGRAASSSGIGSMPSSPSSPAAVEIMPDGPGTTAPAGAEAADQGSRPSDEDSAAAADTALHPPVTGEDSLFDLPHMHAMRDISLGGVSSTGPSDVLHDSMTPTASVQGATLATWVHTSGRSSVSPPPSGTAPTETSITLPSVPAVAAATMLAPPPAAAALAAARHRDVGYTGPNPSAPDPAAPITDGETGAALTLVPPRSTTTGSVGGSDPLQASTRNPGGHTTSSAPGETYGHTTSTAPGSWTSVTSGNAADGPIADRMPSSGTGNGLVSLDLASASVSNDVAEMGTSSLVLTATRSSGITVFRSTGTPAGAPPPRPATFPDAASSGAAVARSGAATAAGRPQGLAGPASSTLPPLGPSQAAAKRLAEKGYSAGASPLSPASANTPTAASGATSSASPMIAAAHMEDGSAGLRRTSADSSTQVASRPLSGVSAATSELTRDISPASSTPVVVEHMHDIAEEIQRQMQQWEGGRLQEDGALGAGRGGPSSGAREAQDSARSGVSTGGSRDRRLLSLSPETSRGPATTSNSNTPRLSTGETEMLCQPTTTPDGSSASHRNRLFSRAWRGLVASSGSLRRSFSPKASSSSAAAAAVTSAGPSSLSTAAATSLAGPRGDFTLVAAHDLRHLSSSPSPSGTSESVLHGPGSGRTPSGLALATAPEPGHARGDSFGSGLSVSAMPAPVGEAGEQLGRVPPGGAADVPWPDLVAAAVNAGAPNMSAASYDAPYAVWKHASMGQMRLVVLARRDVMTLLGGASTSCVATGVAGVGLNKGAVAISCQVWGTEICFVNAHLAAHQSRTAERNKMFRTIARELRLRPTGEALLSSFHHVFFLGDLNYRLNYGGALDYRDGSPGDALAARFQKDLRHAHETGSYDALLAHDQLRAMQLAGKAFVDFHEADISYPPTFKVEREASIVYKPHRLPAWCDRVLWHSNMPHSMHPLCSGYFMVAEADSSDHKPVAAVFTLPAVLSPAQVVSDSIENFVVTMGGLKAHGLLERKMHSRVRKHVSKLRLRHLKLPALRRGASIRLRVHGDDFQQPAKASSSTAAAAVEWKNELKLNCKHAHVEHIRGRMLRFKLSYETGNRRSRRTIAQGALPLMSVMPLPRHTTPQWPVIREEWPFSVPLYHGGVKAGELSGKVRWTVRRNDPFARLALSRVSRIGRNSDS